MDAHLHGQKILSAGFSLKKCADIVCFEVGDNPEGDAEWNKQLSQQSQGLLPPTGQLRYLAVGGNHTVTFLKAVKAGCPTPVPQLQDEHGCLNAAALIAKSSPDLAEALNEGLMWLVIDKRLRMGWGGVGMRRGKGWRWIRSCGVGCGWGGLG